MIARIEQQEFASRRETLMAHLEENSVVIIQSAPMVARNSDVDYLFRQDSDFFYFTGFDEPDATIFLKKSNGTAQYHVFCQPRDKDMEIWFGFRHGEEGVLENYQADYAYSIESIDSEVIKLLDGVANLYYSHNRKSLSSNVQRWLESMRKQKRQGVVAPNSLKQLDDICHEMRLIKSPAEQQMMRNAAEISAQAHIAAMKACQPGVMEYQLEAHIQHHFMMNGCAQAAYPTIVGGGENGCILHYISNSQPLKSNDLVLIDAGAEYQYYAGDITRTFPVNGKFNEEQRALYEIVLKAQLDCIDMVKPGTPWEDIHNKAIEVITVGLCELGLLEGALETLIEDGAYRAFFMHKLGHWLGMDVHDVGDYKVAGQWRTLEAGMVMTVEPGIYVAIDNLDVEERWRGIGIRIEDDVLVTEQGCEVMTASVPKTIDEIESLMAR